LYESRNKEFVLRLLDKKKLQEARLQWQLINIGIPIALIMLLGWILQWRRKKRFHS